MLKVLILFAALTAGAFLVLSMFWHQTTVVFTALDIAFTWRLIVAMLIGGYLTKEIA